MIEWKCQSNCGCCCMHVSDLLPNTNGVCHNYNIELKNCNIYETRPLICRVVEGFDAYNFGLTWDEYVEVNRESCKRLRKAHDELD